jgi:phage repressor protein C with HTH and peptisase S24 domain
VDTDEVVSRLRAVYKCRNNKELAEKLNIFPANISKWKSRNTIPYKEVCETSVEKGVSVNWLLTGQGEVREGGAEYINVPEYKIEASAGHGSLVEDETPSQYIAIKKSSLAASGVNTSNLIIMYARGDSMEPTIYSGDPLFVDRNATNIAPDGGIYIFNYGTDVFVKRLQMTFTGDVLVISDNAKYPSQTIPKADLDQMRIAGRVVVYGRICA